jgi:two-component system sensor histidine kinase BaeS
MPRGPWCGGRGAEARLRGRGHGRPAPGTGTGPDGIQAGGPGAADAPPEHRDFCGPPWLAPGGPWSAGGAPDGWRRRRAFWLRRRGSMRLRMAAALVLVTLVGVFAATVATATGLFGHAPSPVWALRTVPLALLCAAIAAVAATGRVTHGLRRLRDAVERLDLQNLELRVPVEGNDEVAALARAFNRMADRLAAEERVRRELFADVAHELRHPLAVLQGRLELMQDGMVPLDGEQVLQLQDMVLALGREVADLRDLSLADVGQLSLRLAPLDVGALIADLCESIEPVAAARGFRVTVEAPADLPPVPADGDRLRQVLVNLLSNAIRHTPDGGRVAVRAWSEQAALAVEVADSGSGIPAQDLPHVFDRFYRSGDGGTASGSLVPGPRSGLGLAIVRSLVRLHGGEVSATSQPGRGSRFTLRLPLAPPREQPRG